MRLLLNLCLIGLITISTSNVFAQTYLELSQNTNLEFEEIVRQTEAIYADKAKERGTGYKQFKRWEYFSRRSLDKNGRIITNEMAYDRSKAFDKKNKNQKSHQKSLQKSLGSNWTEMGPMSAVNTVTWSSHIGRVSALAIDPNDSDHLVIGSPGGGIWKTLNEGTSWTPIFDDGVLLSCWSLLISHNNDQHYFAGISGQGIIRSLNGGTSWIATNGTSGTINTILMNPNNHNVLIAVNSNGEIFRSTDGGSNWNEIMDISGSVYDMEFKPGVHSIIYVSGSSGIYKSVNNGISFTEITNGPWQNNPKMMAVTPHDPNFIYVLETNSGGFGALYLSTDNGATWSTQMTDFCDCSSNSDCASNNIMGYNQGECGGQAPRDMDVVVSNTDKTEVHVAGTETWKSTNSGTSFSKSTSWLISNSLPFIHADVDFMVYKDDKMYFGTDGGLFISNNALSTVIDKTTGLGIRQFYRIGVSRTDPNRVSGGSQDNGTGIVRNGTWYDFVGADGMETLIDKSDSDIVYATIQYGGLYKSINGGDTRTGITTPPGSGDWVTPLEQDPILNNTIYQGRQQLYKSINGGSSWDDISNFNPPTGSTRMSELAIAPSDNLIIFAAFQRHIYRTIDGGTSWEEVSPNVGFGGVNYVSIHPSNSNKILLSLSGTSSIVMESIDGGDTWENISNGLPELSAQCAIYENGEGGTEGIYVSMNPGVYYKSESIHQWDRLDVGLPNVNVTELQIEHNQLYAATYGRGLWKTNLINDFDCIISSALDLGVESCNSLNSTYKRNFEINFNYPPASTFIIINDQYFPCLSNKQLVSVEYPMNGEFQTFAISFSVDPLCSLVIEDMFSNITECPCGILQANVLLNSCDDNNTTTNSDDTYSLSLNPQTLTGSDSYSVVGDISANNLPYGSAQIISNISNTLGTINFDIIDDNILGCSLNDISFTPPVTCNTNYVCESAFVLSANTTYTAIGPNQGNGGSQGGGDANWFIFHAPSQGVLSIASCLGGEDTRLIVHTGNCNEFNTEFIIDDNCEQSPGGSNYASELTDYCVDAFQTYLIEWDNRWSSETFDFSFSFQATTYYADIDGDNFGDPLNAYSLCVQPFGFVIDNSDCDDSQSAVNPDAMEICDGQDNNCNGNIDEGFSTNTYYRDFDNDGYGDPNVTAELCGLLQGYVDDNNDCDDSDIAINPGVAEICFDNIDNNCDGNEDEGCILEDCDGDFLSISAISQNEYHAEINVTSNAVISNNQNVIFNSGTDIDIEPNFEVEIGSIFTAKIEPCSPITVINKGTEDGYLGIENLELLKETIEKKFLPIERINITMYDNFGDVIFALNSKTKEWKGFDYKTIETLDQGFYILTIKGDSESLVHRFFINN